MKRYELEVLNGELKGQTFLVKQGGIKVGRSSSNDVHIPDAEMSRSHCIVELNADGELRVTDLASANGTRVNGKDIGAKSVELKAGDVIEIGDTRLKVTEPGAAKAKPPESARERDKAPIVIPRKTDEKVEAKKPKDSKETVRQVLWGATIGLLVLAMVLVLAMPSDIDGADEKTNKDKARPAERSLGGNEEPDDAPLFFTYEKVEGDSSKVLRMYAELKVNKTLSVELNEVGGKPRTVAKVKGGDEVDEELVELIKDMFTDVEWDRLEDEYYGPESEPPVLNSYVVSFGFGRKERKRVAIINMPEPEAFRMFRKKLETFINTEFGLMAFELSEAELMERAKMMAETGRMRYEDRDTNYGNLSEAIKAFREAMSYFETINPKPAEYKQYREAREQAEQELDKRYNTYNFEASRAIKNEDWQAAKEMLSIVLQLVGERRDERYREAEIRLNDIEKRLRKGGRK